MNIVHFTVAATWNWLVWFLGGQDDLLLVLISFSLVGYITDVMCAIADKKLSSAAGFVGIFRKITVYLLVGIGRLLDSYILGQIGILRTAIILFYLSSEGVSVLNNASHLGLVVPKHIRDVLVQLRNQAKNGSDKL